MDNSYWFLPYHSWWMSRCDKWWNEDIVPRSLCEMNVRWLGKATPMVAILIRNDNKSANSILGDGWNKTLWAFYHDSWRRRTKRHHVCMHVYIHTCVYMCTGHIDINCNLRQTDVCTALIGEGKECLKFANQCQVFFGSKWDRHRFSISVKDLVMYSL